MKKPKLYELYSTPSGSITCYSKYYDQPFPGSKRHWVVRAVSVKQAYYYAGNHKWADSDDGLGIIGYTPIGSETEWIHWDGSTSWDRPK